MPQLIYAMQFRGQGTPAEGAPGVLNLASTATSGTMTTLLGPDGLTSLVGAFGPAGVGGSASVPTGGSATFSSQATFTGETTFTESGVIEFNGTHRLRFSTVGQGTIGPSAETGVQRGAVIWQVDGGDGQFAGATGLIASNFLVGQAGEVTDNHLGVLFLPQQSYTP